VRLSLDQELLSRSSQLTGREVVNVMWSLGKCGYRYDHDEALISAILKRVADELPAMQSFDFESVMVALGLLEVGQLHAYAYPIMKLSPTYYCISLLPAGGLSPYPCRFSPVFAGEN
jgi:hypothetical protein